MSPFGLPERVRAARVAAWRVWRVPPRNRRGGSINTYRSRFTRAVETYRQFLETGTPPRYRQHVRRPKSADGATPSKPTETLGTGALAAQTSGSSQTERMVDYPFPLKSGGLANFRLPVHLEREDAERMGAFIRTLVFEPQKELEPARSDEDE